MSRILTGSCSGRIMTEDGAGEVREFWAEGTAWSSWNREEAGRPAADRRLVQRGSGERCQTGESCEHKARECGLSSVSMATLEQF